MSSKRTIGITHRRKATKKDGVAKPTMVWIKPANGKAFCIELKTDEEELDFVLGLLPKTYRDVTPDDDLTEIFKRHQREETIKHPDGTETTKLLIPSSYEGFRAGDTVVMCLGGSGDRLAYALSNRGQKIDAQVYRLPPAVLKKHRSDGSKDDDHRLLVEIYQREFEIFYPTEARDRALIMLIEVYRARMEAMKARIECEQRLHQRYVGRIFINPQGNYPEGQIEDMFDKAKANDTVLQALMSEEKARNKELAKAVEAMDIWPLFDQIEGVGPAIAARLIVAIGDIRRFPTREGLKAFLGVHVLTDGTFARRRTGQLANWHPDGRQALYLLGDQLKRRPGSKWGIKLREYKLKFRAKHPPETTESGKKRYTDGHIHQMATWRTLTKFVEWLHREWWKIEKAAQTAK